LVDCCRNSGRSAPGERKLAAGRLIGVGSAGSETKPSSGQSLLNDSYRQFRSFVVGRKGAWLFN
jgi:hypothetical protein